MTNDPPASRILKRSACVLQCVARCCRCIHIDIYLTFKESAEKLSELKFPNDNSKPLNAYPATVALSGVRHPPPRIVKQPQPRTGLAPAVGMP